MATKIETLKKPNGDQVLPRTRAKAVSMENGTSVETVVSSHDSKINEVSAQVDTHLSAENTHFSGQYEDLSGKPAIAEDESGELVIADNAGNILARFDADGLRTIDIRADSIILRECIIRNIRAITDEEILSLFA